MDALRTPIVGESPEARALEDARLANLAERTRLENLQRAPDERARQRTPESSRRQLFPPTQVYRTLVQNLAAAARIAESIQPSQSEASRGLLQIRALLRAAGNQNSAVSQSQNRIHSRSVATDTVQSAHSPRSPPRLGPWRTRAWLTWSSALDWRISSEYSTSKRVSGLPSLVDVSSSRRRRYTEP